MCHCRRMESPLRVGLVGAGPWAEMFTAPLLAAGPDCTLSAVWARRPAAAASLAARHGASAAATFDELLDNCDAVAFAVPPDVQADMAARAASAGRAVLLDKPIGMTIDQAQHLSDAVGHAGVISQVILTNRYLPAMRQFLADASGFVAHGGRAAFFGGGCMAGNYFGTPWRLIHGGLLDLGPHVLDALDAALGTIVEVHAAGDRLGLVALTCRHESGIVSQASMSGTTPVEPSGLAIELYGRTGRIAFDAAAGDSAELAGQFSSAMTTITAEFATAVRSGQPHPLDVHRGLYLQRLITMAEDTLG